MRPVRWLAVRDLDAGKRHADRLIGLKQPATVQERCAQEGQVVLDRRRPSPLQFALGVRS